MKVNNIQHLEIEEGEEFNFRFDSSSTMSAEAQSAQRTLIIHAPVSASVDSAVSALRAKPAKNSVGRSIHLILGRDGKKIIQMVPFDRGAIHAPGYNNRSIGIQLQYPGELLEGGAQFQLTSAFNENEYILASAFSSSHYNHWPLFPKAQLDSLFMIARALKETYEIIDVVAYDEILDATHPGPAFPILQFREKLLGATDRSILLQETAKRVSLFGQPGQEETLLSETTVPRGSEVSVINEMPDSKGVKWYLISVIDRSKDSPWLIGWVEASAVRIRTNFTALVRADHYLTTQEGIRFQEIKPHQNGFDAQRKQPEPKFIIMHFTTGTRMESTISHFKDPGAGVSTHLLIGRDGRVVQLLPFDRIAYHTGYSWWERDKNLNNDSIGIELDNAGLLHKSRDGKWFARKMEIPVKDVKQAVHWKQLVPNNEEDFPGWEIFPQVQLDVALKIIKAIVMRYPSIREILGHDEVSLRDRYDPGPLFPMQKFRRELFGRADPNVHVFTINQDTALYGNFNGRLPNTKQQRFEAILPANSEVKVKTREDDFALVTVLKTKEPRAKGTTGWIQVASLDPPIDQGFKGGKTKKIDETASDIRTTRFDQVMYKRGQGAPTPMVETGPIKQGTKVRIQEVRGEWTLVALLDLVNGKGGWEGWLRTEDLHPEIGVGTADLAASARTDGEDKVLATQDEVDAVEKYYRTSQPVSNDRAQGEDQLGIRAEVEALAETLLLRDVEPPVAVGVMGGWGSGKSFVMYLISRYVEETRAKKVRRGWPKTENEKDPEVPIFVGHVYQIHFNAWTYAKSNLWASLMDTIFSSLNRQMQFERLLAHRGFPPEGKPPPAAPPSQEEIKESMLAGGAEFKKIYLDNPQFGQDKDLERWRKNLDYWSHHLLKGTLLWNVMRGQQAETMEQLKDTEEQLNQLKTRREQFEKERPPNAITPKTLKDETARHAYFQSIKSFMLAFLWDQLSDTAQAELKKQNVKEDDVQKFLEEAKGLSGGVQTLVTAFRQSRLYLIWTLTFLILFFAVTFVWPRFALGFIQPQMARAISLILTLLPTLRVIVPWIKKSINANLEAKKILEGAYATQQAKKAEKIVNATDKPLAQKISDLQAEISDGSLPAYDALIGLLEAKAEEQREKIGPSAKYSNLIEFVQSRLDAATYENQLGLMHQVRQDIDELSYSLVDNAKPEYFPRGKPRVILYIDDLDRCPPSRVVEVLEAVQLLLNTKLFIVILGLDTRYVTRALEKEYKEILQHEGDPSGLDYIEKIIQIPYRVRAIEANVLRSYIEKQMDIEKMIEEMESADTLPVQREQEPMQADLPAQPQPSDETKPLTEQVVAGAVQGPADDGKEEAKEPAPEQSLEPSVQRAEEPAETKAGEPQLPQETKQPEEKPPAEPEQKEIAPLERELPAAVIQFKQEDLDDLAACCQKIALTPRSIKRLVNVFKLMKIFWFRADKNAGIAERDRPRPVKQAAMCLLALASAYPEVMREVFVHLETLYRQGQEQTELFSALNNIKLPPGSASELSWQLQKYKADISTLKTIVGNGQDQFGQLTLQNLKLSTFNIVRSFSFVGDPVYWSDEEGDNLRLNGSPPAKPAPQVKRTRKPPSPVG